MIEGILSFIKDWYELYLLIGVIIAFMYHIRIRVEITRNNRSPFTNNQSIRPLIHMFVLISWVLFYPYKMVSWFLVTLLA